MNILIIEDDPHKYSKILSLTMAILPDARIFHQDNVFGAIKFLRQFSPDKILLDMSLPSHPAVTGKGSPLNMPSGGIEIVLELRSISKHQIPILILTQYPDIEVEYEFYSIDESVPVIKKLYGVVELSAAYYEDDSDNWQKVTRGFLEK